MIAQPVVPSRVLAINNSAIHANELGYAFELAPGRQKMADPDRAAMNAAGRVDRGRHQLAALDRCAGALNPVDSADYQLIELTGLPDRAQRRQGHAVVVAKARSHVGVTLQQIVPNSAGLVGIPVAGRLVDHPDARVALDNLVEAARPPLRAGVSELALGVDDLEALALDGLDDRLRHLLAHPQVIGLQERHHS